jgi:putative ABC transport system ATP-binding protein
VRDNLLFGRIAYGTANAQEKVSDVMKSVLADSGFLDTVYRIGLDYQIGSRGRLLFPRQRAAVDLVRCLVKNPAIFILDDALRAFPTMEAKAILARLTEDFGTRLLITALPGMDDAVHCDLKITFDKGRVTGIEGEDETRSPGVAAKRAAMRSAAGKSPASENEDEGAIEAQVAE